jgi:hypothetical protein
MVLDREAINRAMKARRRKRKDQNDNIASFRTGDIDPAQEAG